MIFNQYRYSIMKKLMAAVPFRVVVMAFAVVALLHCRAAGAPYAVDGRAVKTAYQAKHWVVSDYVVTEFGVAALKGRTLRQRAHNHIEISHPDFRDELKAEYEKRFHCKYE